MCLHALQIFLSNFVTFRFPFRKYIFFDTFSSSLRQILTQIQFLQIQCHKRFYELNPSSQLCQSVYTIMRKVHIFTNAWTREIQLQFVERFSTECFAFCFGFCFTALCDWLTEIRATFSTNEKQNQNQSCLARTRFPALGTGCMHLFRILIGPLCCLRFSWLVGVITLVLVLRRFTKVRKIHDKNMGENDILFSNDTGKLGKRNSECSYHDHPNKDVQ